MICKLIIVGFFLFNVSILNAQHLKNNFLDCTDFYKLMTESENCFLFDLREELKYSKKRITNAVLVDNKDRFKTYLKTVDNDSFILIYCQLGIRSDECFNWLASLGYINVYQLSGGFKNWEVCGFPIDSTSISHINLNNE